MSFFSPSKEHTRPVGVFQTTFSTFEHFPWQNSYQEWGKVFHTEKENLAFQFECRWGKRLWLEQWTKFIQEHRRWPKEIEEWSRNILKKNQNRYRKCTEGSWQVEATTVSKKGREKERKKIAVCTLSFKFHFPDYHINGVTERPYQMNSKYAVARSKCPAHLLTEIGLDNNSRRKKKYQQLSWK